MKRVACLLLCLFLPALVLAAEPQVEGSMLVTGTITVNPQGGVQSYTVRDLDKLPPAVRQIIQTTVSRWQFLPIMAGGKAVTAEAGMSLRIVADMVDRTHATIRVAGAEFGCDARPKSNLPGECPAGTAVRYAHRKLPMYPRDALLAGVSGEVFLAMQVGRDGHVTQAAVRQVNLYEKTDESAYYRKMLAEASLGAVKNWQFLVPTKGPDATKDYWVVQVPINYTLGPPGSIPKHRYGQWNAYIPGPVQTIPWAHNHTGGSGDAVADNGQPFTRDSRFVLETKLGGGTG